MSGTVYFLGDSTLDNLFWIEKSKDAIEDQLTEELQSHGYKVENLAYDGFTTQNVLEGGEIGEVLLGFKEEEERLERPMPEGSLGYKAYLEQRGSGEVKPLEKLKEKVSKAPSEQTNFAVLSVGGNDFRENLGDPLKFLSSISEIRNRYFQIIDRLQALKSRNVQPILMFQYRTDAVGHDPYKVYSVTKLIGTICVVMQTAPLSLSFALAFSAAPLSCFRLAGICSGLFFAFLGHRFAPIEQVISTKDVSMVVVDRLMENFYLPILERARKEKIPILDLPNTFNPYDKLYAYGIEPNERGGKLIASGIKQIVLDQIALDHSPGDPSFLYSSKNGKEDGFEKTENSDPCSWRVTFPPKVEHEATLSNRKAL